MAALAFGASISVPANSFIANFLTGDPMSDLPYPAELEFWGTGNAIGLQATIRVDEIQIVNAFPLNTAVAAGVIDTLRDAIGFGGGEKRALVTVFVNNTTGAAIIGNIRAIARRVG